MKKKQAKTRQIESISALATSLERARSTVRKWLEHPRWRWSRKAPWSMADIPAMKAWAAATLAPDYRGGKDLAGEQPNRRRAADDALKAARLRKLLAELRALRRKYWNRAELEQGWAEREQLLRRHFEPLAAQLAPQIAATAAPYDAEKLATDAVNVVLYRLAKKSDDAPAPAAPKAEPVDKDDVGLRYKLAQREKLDIERDIIEGKYVLRQDAIDGLVRRAVQFKYAIVNTAGTISLRYAGMTAPEVEAELAALIASVLDRYAHRPRPGLDDGPDVAESAT